MVDVRWNTQYELGLLKPEYVTLHTTGPLRVVKSPKLKLKSITGVLAPTVSEEELKFFSSKTGVIADIAFLAGNWKKAWLDLFPPSDSSMRMLLGEGKARGFEFSVSLSKHYDEVIAAAQHEYDYHTPDTAFAPIGLFESSSEFQRRVRGTSDVLGSNFAYRRSLRNEFDQQVGGLEGIVASVSAELKTFGIETHKIEFLSGFGHGRKMTERDLLGSASSAEMVVGNGLKVRVSHLDRTLTIKSSYKYADVDSQKLAAGLAELCKALSAFVYVCNPMRAMRNDKNEREIWNLMQSGVLRPATYDEHLKAGVAETYGNAFVATRSFTAVPLSGSTACQLQIILPRGVECKGDRGHIKVYTANAKPLSN